MKETLQKNIQEDKLQELEINLKIAENTLNYVDAALQPQYFEDCVKRVNEARMALFNFKKNNN